MKNRVVVHARLVRADALRHTPAGIAVLTFAVVHRSSQQEAGVRRDVNFEMECIAIGDTAHRLGTVNTESEIELSGFIAAKSQKSRMLVLHVTEFDLK